VEPGSAKFVGIVLGIDHRFTGPSDGNPRPPVVDGIDLAEECNVELTLEHRTEGAATVLVVAGEVDVYTAPKLREKLVELVSDGHYNIVVDMTKVEFLDSTGLGVLVGGLKRVRSHNGSLELVCDQERILKIFRITGLTKVFPIHDTLEEALS
jgi:anti-sigma B factor antagonist